MQNGIEGIYTPTLVPLDGRGNINEDELRRYVGWLISRGVHGLYPNGSTGEFTRFTDRERRQIVKIVAEEAAGRVPILAGAAEANVRQTLEACEYYAGCGVSAVAIVSPFYYKLDEESLFAYFREIALHSVIDVTLYNIPMFASPIDLKTIRRLAEFDRIVGIKDSSGDLAFMMRMIAAVRPNRPDFSFLTGWEALLVPMLMVGCNGGTHASSGVVPEVTKSAYELTRAGQFREAIQLQYRLLELFDVMLTSVNFPNGFRVGVELRGFDFGASRQPQTDLQQNNVRVLKERLQKMLLQSGIELPAP